MADRRSTTSNPSRRDFILAALATGGTSALSACLEREAGMKTPESDVEEFPRGPSDLSSLPERQHAWQDYLSYDRFGNSSLPQHHVLLMLNYTGDTPPTEDQRDTVEAAFQTVERAFARGTGGSKSAIHHEGLLFTMGYSPAYFDQFDVSLPADIDLPSSDQVLTELDEDDVDAEEYDAVLHLASGYAAIVLASEEMFFEDLDRINGVDVTGTLSDVFEIADRRPGFIGKGQPSKKYDNEAIHDNAPLSMGFKGGFQDNLPHEDNVTITEGPFAQGTTQQISQITIDLDDWYEESREDRIKQMFTPDHTFDEVGEHGENLAGHSHKTREMMEKIDEDAEEGMLGHGQKTAMARTEDDFTPRISRRDFNAIGEPGMHFNSWQRGISDFVETRKAMNGEDYRDEVAQKDNGILGYIDVVSRGTFLVPPRALRALPSPRPDRSTGGS